jgi:two-component system sensor histidine kinase HydH
MLVVTLAMGAALVGTSVMGFLDARAGSSAMTQASVAVLVRGVRREMRHNQGNPAQALESAVQEMGEQGLKFAALVDGTGSILARAGEAQGSLDPDALLPQRHRFPVEEVGQEGRVRVVLPAGPMGPGHHGPWEGPPPGAGAPPSPGDDEAPGPPWARPAMSPGFPEHARHLVLEVSPEAARTLTARAATTVGLSLLAATVLLVLALASWRQSRRADLFTAQLAQDRQLKALGQMSAVLGHEIRNPLASLKGHAQLVLERLPEGHAGRKGAETVVREATRIETLTNHILDFARTGVLDLAPEDPVAVARAAVERSHAAPVVLEAVPGLPAWPVDRARLEQVLVNLLDNARQATTDGAPVTLGVARSGDALVFRVRDRGPGILPGDEARVFEPFFTTKTRGTGLGLALARRIVEGHGGTITAGNAEGGGADFTVLLPRGRGVA